MFRRYKFIYEKIIKLIMNILITGSSGFIGSIKSRSINIMRRWELALKEYINEYYSDLIN